MRGFIFGILSAMMLCAASLCAAQQQNPQTAANRAATVAPGQRSEWLSAFSGISINGRMHVRIIRNAAEEAPRITYDTKGELATKFKTTVDRNGILKIEEPVDPKRTTATEVTIWCNDIISLSVTAADLTCETPVTGDMFDLEVGGGANVTARFDVTDLAVTATGKSSIILSGAAKYMTLDISTAKFDGGELQTVSSIVNASHLAEVRLAVSERLEGTTSTSAKIVYSGVPHIIRAHTTMFGGEILPLEN